MSLVLFCDVETGGLDPKTDALLSVGLAVLSDGEIVGSAHWDVQPEGRRVDPEALAVNGIDLDRHVRFAYSREVVAGLVATFCRTVFGEQPATLGGHVVSFDVGFLKELFVGRRYGTLFSHRTIDTAIIARFLMDAGLLRAESAGLGSVCEALGIVNPRPHDALEDALASAAAYAKMLKLVRTEAPLNV